jgi:NAD(P)-dependent dehydrogenase (short-subunit alcohol dehydrogenase family)
VAKEIGCDYIITDLSKREDYTMKNGYGRIINLNSIHGLVASEYKVAYVSAKHGLMGLTKTELLKVVILESQLTQFVQRM